MIILIFIVGSLLGLLLGALVSIRFVRQGVTEDLIRVTADLIPKLGRMQGQLNTIEAELAYMVSARYAEINGRPSGNPRRDNP